MNKEEYKKSLHRHYPEEPDNVLELAWHFHGMEKAKKYIKLLETCNHNADLAIKAIRAMYVSCDIDAVKAVSEKFITVLLPFTCMEKTAKPHSVTFHVRKMLDDCDVKAERKTEEARLRQACLTRQRANSPSRTADVTIQIRFQTDNEDLIRQQTRLEERESQISQSLRKFATQLAEDYQMTLEVAKGQASHLDNVEQTRQSLQGLERSIKALGPVNVDAIAQFEEVKQRLDFLNGQKDNMIWPPVG